MNEPRRPPERGEVIALPYDLGHEPTWIVRSVERRGGYFVVIVEHLLDLRCQHVLMLKIDGQGAA